MRHNDSRRPLSIELEETPRMDRVRQIFQRKKDYQPLENDQATESLLPNEEENETDPVEVEENPFSWLEYAIFLLMGVAMLWAWNMFLAAAPYFQRRFESNKPIQDSFQATEISVSTVTNMCSMIILTKLQRNASYSNRIIYSLILTTVCFTLLAVSTVTNVSAAVYFGFLIGMVCLSSLATGLIQNGLFAFTAGFGRSEYTQAIMTGQAVAGVLPCIAQIASVLVVGPPKHKNETRPAPPADGMIPQPPASVAYRSARLYFILATSISVAALLAFLFLLRRQKQKAIAITNAAEPTSPTEGAYLSRTSSNPSEAPHKSIPLHTLFLKLPFFSLGVFLCFAVTMVFPVMTTLITSVNPDKLPPPIFIPLAFLLWNSGDLVGRLLPLIPALHMSQTPIFLFFFALARLIFIPLYFLCNLRGHGAIINSDIFYLVFVQFLYGLSNGYLGSECMMGAGDWVQGEDEKKAAGAWMGLCLTAGLTVGSLASFVVVSLV